jgi:class 3 adenylate cyclase
VQAEFPTRELGAVAVRGRTRPVKIYTVLSEEAAPEPAEAETAAVTAAESNPEPSAR